MFNPTSPVVGPTTITGLTNPTYTLTEQSSPPDTNCRQFVVLTVGGTQTGVTTHSVSSPFTLSMFVPKTLKILGNPNPVTGVIANVAMNVYKNIVRKGVTVLTGQPLQIAMMKTESSIPAGSELNDLPNVRAMVALHAGTFQVNANEIVNTMATAVL